MGMELEDSFEVPAPPERVWDFLLDLERVTPCMPGAELTELPDPDTWKGKVTIKLGAVSMSYAATVVVEEKDEQTRTVVLKASGRETRGRGMASATINSTIEAVDGGASRVVMGTDLTVSGAVAQYGRGMIADVSKRLTGQFAECLAAQIAAEPAAAAAADNGGQASARPAAPPPPPPVAKPIGGFRLAAWALARAFGRLIARIFGAIRSLFSRG